MLSFLITTHHHGGHRAVDFWLSGAEAQIIHPWPPLLITPRSLLWSYPDLCSIFSGHGSWTFSKRTHHSQQTAWPQSRSQPRSWPWSRSRSQLLFISLSDHNQTVSRACRTLSRLFDYDQHSFYLSMITKQAHTHFHIIFSRFQTLQDRIKLTHKHDEEKTLYVHKRFCLLNEWKISYFYIYTIKDLHRNMTHNRHIETHDDVIWGGSVFGWDNSKLN